MVKKKEKFDFKKEYRFIFKPSAKEPQFVEVPAFKYLMIRGEGYPGTSEEFQQKIQVLYGLAYTLKFKLKQDPEDPFDYTVPPLSGIYYAEDYNVFHDPERFNEWKWTLGILQPDRITEQLIHWAGNELKSKKDLPYIDEARLEIYKEGLSAQILHVGPYSEEGPTIKRLHQYINEKGYQFNGDHHEIYLGDPRRSKPEKLKTIIRHPIKKK